jgi:hypothetical protein
MKKKKCKEKGLTNGKWLWYVVELGWEHEMNKEYAENQHEQQEEYRWSQAPNQSNFHLKKCMTSIPILYCPVVVKSFKISTTGNFVPNPSPDLRHKEIEATPCTGTKAVPVRFTSFWC